MMGEKPEETELDATELGRLTGVTPRTIYYYAQQGLIPPAAGAGPGPKYGRRHVARLKLIKRLQRQHLPLAEIGRRLKRMTDDEVEQALAETATTPAATDSALDYVRSVLRDSTPRTPPQLQRRLSCDLAPNLGIGTPAQTPGERSQWERITLADGLELHVRRPMDRPQQKALGRLLRSAREIFSEEQS